MLTGLDPHSSYMVEELPRHAGAAHGEFGGLGIRKSPWRRADRVVAIDETPAAKAGVMANDIITHLDEEPVQGLTLNQAVERCAGQ
jgi:carboxyl-terminal processing protease